MKFTPCVYTSPNDQKVFDYPSNFYSEKILRRTQKFEIGTRTEKVMETIVRGICIRDRYIHHSRPCEVTIDLNIPSLMLVYKMEGDASFKFQSHLQDLHLEKDQHQIYFFPSITGKLNALEHEKARNVEILISLQFLEKHFESSLPFMKAIQEALQLKKPICFSKHNGFITHEFKELLNEILKIEDVDLLSAYLLETKVKEIVIKQLFQLHTVDCLHTNENSIEAVACYIQEHLDEQITIERLSKKFGINQNTLQKEFKKKFHATIYQFSLNFKLEKAAELLLLTLKPVEEIAYEIGYSQSHHFGYAFKKKYNSTPSQFRRMNQFMRNGI